MTTVVFEMPCPDQRLLFVASDLEDKTQAELEIVRWASEHGYRLPGADRVFSLYQDGMGVRDWRLLERRAAN